MKRPRPSIARPLRAAAVATALLAALVFSAACGDSTPDPSGTRGAAEGPPPMQLTLPVPSKYAELSPGDRKERCEWGDTDETLIIRLEDETHYYVQADLPIAVKEGGEPLVLTVWTTVTQEKFERILMLWHNTIRVEEPVYFAWMNEGIATFPPAVPLKANLNWKFSPPGKRPQVALEPTEHPLSLAQQQGLSREKAELVSRTMNAAAVMGK